MKNSSLSFWRIQSAAAILSGILTITSPVSAQHFDFNDGTLNGLAKYDPLALFGAGANYSFVSGALQIQVPASPNPALVGPARAGVFVPNLDVGLFKVSVDLVNWDNNLLQSIGLMGRVGQVGLGTSMATNLRIRPGAFSTTLRILRRC